MKKIVWLNWALIKKKINYLNSLIAFYCTIFFVECKFDSNAEEYKGQITMKKRRQFIRNYKANLTTHCAFICTVIAYRLPSNSDSILDPDFDFSKIIPRLLNNLSIILIWLASTLSVCCRIKQIFLLYALQCLLSSIVHCFLLFIHETNSIRQQKRK